MLVELELLPLAPWDEHDGSRPLLVVEALEVRYQRRLAVRDVGLRVERGEVVALIGHNGCGKSSTLRAIAGLVPPAAGVVVVDGRRRDGTPAGAAGATLGFVPADGEVFADLTVQENLWLGGRREPDGAVLAARTAEVLAWFPELGRRLGTAAGRLSGGERRMLGLGIALMGRPPLLLLDEPTRHLAPAVAARVLDVVRMLATEQRIGVLMAEVNVAAALSAADRAYVMNSGEIRAEHSAAELLAAGPAAWWRMF